MRQILEAAAASATAAQALAAESVRLATGERWRASQPTNAPPIEYAEKPQTEWGRTVDGIEAPFAPNYDKEEYANPALRMLNLAEFAMLAKALGTGFPWQTNQNKDLSNKTWLDIGCGTGRVASFAASLDVRLTAIDQTAGYVQTTADKLAKAGKSNARLVVAPAETIVQEQTKYDVITAMFAVLNHCEDWAGVTAGLARKLSARGVLALSMYGSPEAAVFAELQNGLPYEPAILVRRTTGGLLLGENADEILPAKFPYPAEVLDRVQASGLTITKVEPFLGVTALYPRKPDPKSVATYIHTVTNRYGSETGSYLATYAASPAQLLVASLCADYQVPAERINEAAYFGVVARKEES